MEFFDNKNKKQGPDLADPEVIPQSGNAFLQRKQHADPVEYLLKEPKAVNRTPVLRVEYYHESVLTKKTGSEPGRENTIRVSPVEYTWDNINQGRILYRIYCVKCHGEKGRGVGNSMGTSSVNLSFSGDGVLHKDDYLFWTLSEGGAPLGGEMTAFKNLLLEDQIWKVILYLKTLS